MHSPHQGNDHTYTHSKLPRSQAQRQFLADIRNAILADFPDTCAGTGAPPPGTPPHGHGALNHVTQEQAALLVTDPDVPEERRVRYALAFLLGLRDGELAALAWTNVKLEARLPHLEIRRALVTRDASGNVRIFRIKARDRMRKLPLPSLAFEVLERWREHGWLAWVGRKPEGRDPVFPDRQGAWVRPASTHHIQRDFVAAGLQEEPGLWPRDFHATRRSFASWLDDTGVSATVIRRLMGLESNALSPRLRRLNDLGAQRRVLETIELGIQASDVVVTDLTPPSSPTTDPPSPVEHQTPAEHTPPASQDEPTPLQKARRLLDELEQQLPALAHDVDPSTGLAWEVEMVTQSVACAKAYLRAVEAFEPPCQPSPARDVHGRTTPSFVVGTLPDDCPRYVWSLHLVPGRLDGPPLAARRRVLNMLDNGFLEVEVGRHRVHVHSGKLIKRGWNRSLGWTRRDGGTEPIIWFYLHCPTNEEREQWVERRHREVALLSQRQFTFWVNVPSPHQDAPDVAVACSGQRLMYVEDTSDEWQGRRDVGASWDEYGESLWEPIDLFDLLDADDGLPRMYRDLQRFFWEHPTPEQLASIGQLRTERRKQAEDIQRMVAEQRAAEQRRAQEKREAEQRRLQEEVRRRFEEMEAQRQRAQRMARPITGEEALRELGLAPDSSATDVRRAYRERIHAEKLHPDHKFHSDYKDDPEQFLWLGKVMEAALQVVWR